MGHPIGLAFCHNFGELCFVFFFLINCLFLFQELNFYVTLININKYDFLLLNSNDVVHITVKYRAPNQKTKNICINTNINNIYIVTKYKYFYINISYFLICFYGFLCRYCKLQFLYSSCRYSVFFWLIDCIIYYLFSLVNHITKQKRKQQKNYKKMRYYLISIYYIY